MEVLQKGHRTAVIGDWGAATTTGEGQSYKHTSLSGFVLAVTLTLLFGSLVRFDDRAAAARARVIGIYSSIVCIAAGVARVG